MVTKEPGLNARADLCPISSSGNGPLAPPPDRTELGDEPSNYQAGRGRKLQVTGRGRERFDKTKRRTFLEWFAATCNATLAARMAGVNSRTPYRTRMNDGAFAEAWDLALEQGYARLEAKLLEMQFREVVREVEEFDPAFEPEESEASGPSTTASAVVPLPPPAFHRRSSADGALKPAPPTESGGGEVLTDPAMAMQLLRQHRAEVMRIRASGGRWRRGGGRAMRSFGGRWRRA